YDDLNDFSKCIWCNEECCSQRILAYYDKNSGPFEYLIQQQDKKVQNKTGKNQYKDNILKAADECIEDILVNNLSKEEATIKFVKNNPQ
ncbi:11682_t:CDS:1, partial [Dentiscutata heterogama]